MLSINRLKDYFVENLEDEIKKFKTYPKQRLPKTILVGETSLIFPITPQKSLSNIKADFTIIKKYFKNV